MVIVGGGFGGLACASALGKAEADVTLIDRRNHNLFQPLLYQVAARSSLPQTFPNRFGVRSGDIAMSPVSSTTKPDP